MERKVPQDSIYTNRPGLPIFIVLHPTPAHPRDVPRKNLKTQEPSSPTLLITYLRYVTDLSFFCAVIQTRLKTSARFPGKDVRFMIDDLKCPLKGPLSASLAIKHNYCFILFFIKRDSNPNSFNRTLN